MQGRAIAATRASTAGRTIEQVPWLVQPPEALPVVVRNPTAAPTVVIPASGVETVVATYVLPPSTRGIIRTLSCTLAGTVTNTTAVLWRVKSDNVLVESWDFFAPPRPAATSTTISWGADETFIFFEPGRTITVTAQSLDALVYAGSVIGRGWAWGD